MVGTMEIGVHAYIEGEVMNGHYRIMLKRLAREKGVRGWARPLVDGRIEAVFRGAEDAVNEVLDELREASLTGRRRDSECSESLVRDVETRELEDSDVANVGGFNLIHGARLTPTGIGLEVDDCDNVEKKGGKLVDVEGTGDSWLRCRLYGYEPLEPRHCDACDRGSAEN